MLILLALIAWVFGGTSGAAESKLAGGEIRALGSTRLSEWGYVSTDVIRFPAMRTLSFDFPEDAAQGPRIWYVLHLHFEVVMAPDSDGVALVSAATNERTAAQIEVETHPGQPLTYSAIGPDRREDPNSCRLTHCRRAVLELSPTAGRPTRIRSVLDLGRLAGQGERARPDDLR